MATTAADPVFVDTNILIYAAIASSPFYGPAIGKLDSFRRVGVELWVSRQTLREYLAAPAIYVATPGGDPDCGCRPLPNSIPDR